MVPTFSHVSRIPQSSLISPPHWYCPNASIGLPSNTIDQRCLFLSFRWAGSQHAWSRHSSTQRCCPETHPCLCVHSLLNLFPHFITSHCMNTLQFLYLFYRWWTLFQVVAVTLSGWCRTRLGGQELLHLIDKPGPHSHPSCTGSWGSKELTHSISLVGGWALLSTKTHYVGSSPNPGRGFRCWAA